MKRTLWIAVVAVGLAQVGCGGKSDPSVAGGASAPDQQTNQIAEGNGAPPPPPGATNQAAAGPLDAMVPLSSLNLANPTKPEEVVGAFLDGMRTGNATVIANLLSTRARKEIADKGLDIAPIGSPQAKFEIGAAQFADPNDPNTVLVSSNWLEPGAANGQPASEYEVVWALIREAAGWRICEMAVDTHQEGEEIQVVNFENLADVVPAGNAPAANVPPTNNPAGNVPRTAANPVGTNPNGVNPNGLSPNGVTPSIPNGAPPALPPANLPSNNFPASNPPSAGGLPALPGASGGGSGSLPPLPPAGPGVGNSGQSGIR